MPPTPHHAAKHITPWSPRLRLPRVRQTTAEGGRDWGGKGGLPGLAYGHTSKSRQATGLQTWFTNATRRRRSRRRSTAPMTLSTSSCSSHMPAAGGCMAPTWVAGTTEVQRDRKGLCEGLPQPTTRTPNPSPHTVHPHPHPPLSSHPMATHTPSLDAVRLVVKLPGGASVALALPPSATAAEVGSAAGAAPGAVLCAAGGGPLPPTASLAHLGVENGAVLEVLQVPDAAPDAEDESGAESGVVLALASTTSFAPVCGHATNRTVTRLVDGVAVIVCEACYQAARPGDEAARRHARPVTSDPCGLCGEGTCVTPAGASVAGSRPNADLGFGVCDHCTDGNLRLQAAADARHVPSLTAVPDEVVPGVLLIGPKESAYNRATLTRLGVARVLVCCSSLLEYHGEDTGLLYHRIPMADSLDENLAAYLPSALAFIAQGAGAGAGPTLVHCNAGVSRSGAVVVEWLRRTQPALGGSVDAALAAAKAKRPIITPNTNFVRQLRALEASGEGAPPSG
jgi:protein-tyrosine phosphatase